MRLLQQILGAETALADLQRRRRRELGLQQQLRRALPAALAAHIGVADARFQELELIAASGAAAALVRQRAPDLLHKLAGEGWEFTGIRVRVQARPADAPPQKRHMEQLDNSAATTLRTLAAQIGEGPLAKALRRLASHSGAAAGSDHGDQALEGVKDQDAEQ
ncbi:MAG: DciA family protein [Casimicrobiaceae bacterium]